MMAVNNDEFELFVQDYGRDILRFCRMTAGNREHGDELYQDTMLRLLEKRDGLDYTHRIRSYALSVAIFLWKNRKKKYATRTRLLPMESMDELADGGKEFTGGEDGNLPEQVILKKDEVNHVQKLVASLPEKYRLPLYLYYSADLQINEIARIMNLPEGTVKSRMCKAKKILKERLEATGYER